MWQILLQKYSNVLLLLCNNTEKFQNLVFCLALLEVHVSKHSGLWAAEEQGYLNFYHFPITKVAKQPVLSGRFFSNITTENFLAFVKHHHNLQTCKEQ